MPLEIVAFFIFIEKNIDKYLEIKNIYCIFAVSNVK